jgi:hypothetical protein
MVFFYFWLSLCFAEVPNSSALIVPLIKKKAQTHLLPRYSRNMKLFFHYSVQVFITPLKTVSSVHRIFVNLDYHA